MPTASRGRARSTHRDDTRFQVLLGWLALSLVLACVLWNGATPPLAWLVLCLMSLLLFAAQVARDVSHGLTTAARRGLWVALPFFAVLIWLQIQLSPGVAPGLMHPFWALAPDGAAPTISAAPENGWKVVMRLTCYGMLFWVMVRSSGAASNGAMAYIQAFAVFSTALAIYGMLSQVTGFNYLLDSEEPGRALRASLWNRNSYATVAVFGALANITCYVQSVSDRAHRAGLHALRDYLEAFFSGGWVFAFGALIGLAALAMTLSRGGAIAGAAGVVVLMLALRRGTGTVSPTVIAVPIAVAVFVALFMTSGVVDRFELISQEARPDIFRQTIVGVLDRPWLGHGAGAFPEAFRPYVPLSQAQWDWSKAHNSYLENAFEFGLPGAALFYFALAMVGWRLLSGVRTRKRHQSTPAFALACFAAAAVHSLLDFSLQIPAIAALFAAIMGIGWGQSFPTRRSTGPTASTSRPVRRSRRG